MILFIGSLLHLGEHAFTDFTISFETVADPSLLHCILDNFISAIIKCGWEYFSKFANKWFAMVLIFFIHIEVTKV